ncbi:MAG: hypothetical protein HZY76_04100 [Anaerolineae bacterium]|nr:MAG: hypothetical protein HZY76_04100 [Anaerolineae bacterium]
MRVRLLSPARGGLELAGAGVLITGPSGAGKTTTMLQCVRAGFQFVADDATLLHLQSDGQVRAVSTLNTMHVTRQTSALFPELAVPVQDQRGDKTTLFCPKSTPRPWRPARWCACCWCRHCTGRATAAWSHCPHGQCWPTPSR